MVIFQNTQRQNQKNEYGKLPDDSLNVAKNQLVADDIVLCFKISGTRISHIEWMYVDFIGEVDENDEAYDNNYPYQAVQVNSSKQYVGCHPFEITTEFRKAFAKAVKKIGIEAIESSESLIPTNELIELIKDYLVAPEKT